jgi:hypothetical protein
MSKENHYIVPAKKSTTNKNDKRIDQPFQKAIFPGRISRIDHVFTNCRGSRISR